MPLMCPHPDARDRQVCVHLAADDDLDHVVRFTGVATDYLLVCSACGDDPQLPVAGVCKDCFAVREGQVFSAIGIRGRPEVRSRVSNLRFEHRSIRVPGVVSANILAIAALADGDRCSWLALVGGTLARVDLDAQRLVPIVDFSAEAGLDLAARLRLEASPDGRFAAVVNSRGHHGVVVNVATGAITMRLERDDYHEEHCDFSVAFFLDGERPVLVHATAWNRLELSDPADGTLLTPRAPTAWTDAAKSRPEHYLDYFHAGLTVSPDHRRLVDDGWVWHPVGVLRSLDLHRWRHENPWESEDGASLRELRSCAYHWDGPRCFADNRTLVAWGFGADDDHLIDAAVVYDVETGRRIRWFAGPRRGRFDIVDGHLINVAAGGTGVWDLTTGEHLLEVDGFAPIAFHAVTRCHLSIASDGELIVSRLVGD